MTRDAISRTLFEFIKQQGLEAELCDNGYIAFEHAGSDFGLEVDENDTLCYHVTLNNVTQVHIVAGIMGTEDENVAKYAAMSAAMAVMTRTNAKVVVDGLDQVDVKIDLLCPSPEVFQLMFPHAMEILANAAELLLQTLHRLTECATD